MNSDERQLISDLFDRMRSHGPVEKDPQAATLINDHVRAIPDAPYMLVQSVLVQDMALQQADQRIQELEAQVSALQATRPAASGGSFLGGLFGGGTAQQRTSSGAVPSVGRRPMGAPRPAEPQGRTPRGASTQPAPAAAGGGFMRSAMATAAGVAGGMLLADGIRSMMSGNESGSGATETASAGDGAATADYQDPADNDPGYQDAAYDDGGDFGGDFDV